EMEAEMDRVHFVVLGVGVNVNATEFPEDIAATATSLRLAAGREIPRATFTGAVLDAVERCAGELERGGFAGLRERWLARAAYRGERVRIDAGGRTVRGTLTDLGEDGALILRGEDGGEVRVLAGDVRSLRPGDPLAGA
ncbi:MAG: biotin--[acetyl-CoA-carboxylase] ligase, partial [Candidatus Methylomirabilis sp.]|nr:biotin--[acetyl-CoA-carboxylase] ligase [Deltaproteobacteria bacterium]